MEGLFFCASRFIPSMRELFMWGSFCVTVERSMSCEDDRFSIRWAIHRLSIPEMILNYRLLPQTVTASSSAPSEEAVHWW